MKMVFVTLSILLISFVADASTKIDALPVPVQNAMKVLKSQHVRTIHKELNLTKKVPCLPFGKSYDVQIQVSRAVGFNKRNSELVYDWDIVKTVNVSSDGKITEVCLEEI